MINIKTTAVFISAEGFDDSGISIERAYVIIPYENTEKMEKLNSIGADSLARDMMSNKVKNVLLIAYNHV